MTISLGIICRKSIVLATDMQASFPGTSHKNNEADKLHEFDFGGVYAVVVMSGGLDYFDSLVERLEMQAQKTTVKNQRSIPDAVEAAIREVKASLRRNSVPPKKGKEWSRVFSDNGCQVLVAFCHDGQTLSLYRADFLDGQARAVRSSCAMLGTPQVLVDYILAEARPDEMKTSEGMALATYVVQMAKDHDQFCGGRTRLAIVYPEIPWILAQTEIAPFVKAATDFERSNIGSWSKNLTKFLPKDIDDTYEH